MAGFGCPRRLRLLHVVPPQDISPPSCSRSVPVSASVRLAYFSTDAVGIFASALSAIALSFGVARINSSQHI